METQTAILEDLPSRKPLQQAENNTSSYDFPQENVNQLNQSIIFKWQANQEYNNQSQHHVLNNQYQKVNKPQNHNYY